MGLWSDPAASNPFRPSAQGLAHLEALERVGDWTRGRYRLEDDETVIVREAVQSLPGFPPRETHVMFWTRAGGVHRFRVFKRAEEVTEGDIPPEWLKDSLAASDGFECDCC